MHKQQLRDIWTAQAAKINASVARVEALSWLSRATLDIVGLAGTPSAPLQPHFFIAESYKIDALGAEEAVAPNELAEAFEAIFAPEMGSRFSFARFLQLWFPILRSIHQKLRIIRRASNDDTYRMVRLVDSKREISDNGFETNTDTASGRARELFTLFRIWDEDVIAQVPTFLLAGHGAFFPPLSTYLARYLRFTQLGVQKRQVTRTSFAPTQDAAQTRRPKNRSEPPNSFTTTGARLFSATTVVWLRRSSAAIQQALGFVRCPSDHHGGFQVPVVLQLLNDHLRSETHAVLGTMVVGFWGPMASYAQIRSHCRRCLEYAMCSAATANSLAC
ncbi:hypothetical protein B0H19DRAFT_1083885 [Mycena capillaripes]|nr:hypothetical protein B0H19DRAFT_1083885 [Mycena capillaripes]